VPSFRWKCSGLVFTHFCNSSTNFWKLETLYNNLENHIHCKKYISLLHIQVPYTCYQQVLSAEVNQLWNEADHSPPPSTQIKNTSTPPNTVMAQCSIKHSTTLSYLAFLFWSPVTVNKPKSKCIRCIKIQYRTVCGKIPFDRTRKQQNFSKTVFFLARQCTVHPYVNCFTWTHIIYLKFKFNVMKIHSTQGGKKKYIYIYQYNDFFKKLKIMTHTIGNSLFHVQEKR